MKTKTITITALGIALYVVVSMFLKIPLGVGHLALDLGYIVLAVYCYSMGPIIGAIVGGAGCTIVSLISSGWFPLGWLLGNILIGYTCGRWYKEEKTTFNCVLSIAAIVLGVLGIKTIVECLMFSIPLVVKLPKNGVAALTDSIVMCLGVIIAPKVHTILESKSLLLD